MEAMNGYKLVAYTVEGNKPETTTVRKKESVLTRFSPKEYRWLTVTEVRNGLKVITHYIPGPNMNDWRQRTQTFTEIEA